MIPTHPFLFVSFPLRVVVFLALFRVGESSSLFRAPPSLLTVAVSCSQSVVTTDARPPPCPYLTHLPTLHISTPPERVSVSVMCNIFSRSGELALGLVGQTQHTHTHSLSPPFVATHPLIKNSAHYCYRICRDAFLQPQPQQFTIGGLVRTTPRNGLLYTSPS